VELKTDGRILVVREATVRWLGVLVSTTGIVHADVTLTRSKVNVKVTELLNFPKLAKPCMLAAMTVSALRGFLVIYGRPM